MIYFLSDVQGLNPEKIKIWCEAFEQPINFISPYHSLARQPERQDYQSFITNVGLDKYTQFAQQKIQPHGNEQTILIGESVGATVLWRLANEPRFSNTNMVCLYGSRIRDYLDLKPRCPITLYFSEQEQLLAPQVAEITQHITFANVEFINAPHGFASPTNANYSKVYFGNIVKHIQKQLLI